MEKSTAHKKSWFSQAAGFDALYFLKQTLLAFFVLLFTCEQVYGLSCMVGDRCCATHVDKQQTEAKEQVSTETDSAFVEHDHESAHQHDSENLEKQAEHNHHQGDEKGSCHCCSGNQESSVGCTCKHGEKPLPSSVFIFPALTGVNQSQFNFEFSVQYELHGHSLVVQPETPPPRV